MRSLKTTPSVGKSGTSLIRSRRSSVVVTTSSPPSLQVADEQEVRELLGDSRERLQVVERVLAPLGVARAQAGRDELLDERRLAPRCRQDSAQVTRVDAEARESRAGRDDVRLALAIETLPALGARHDEAVLLQLVHEVGRHRGAIAELVLVDLPLAAEDTRARAASGRSSHPGPSSASRITRSGRNSSRCMRRIVVSRSTSSARTGDSRHGSAAA